MTRNKRVFVGSIATETNSFSPLRADLQDFKEVLETMAGRLDEVE
jgi:microcystin degradation protein MlrC